jgi:DNA-binding YbaB/EbfC family protein
MAVDPRKLQKQMMEALQQAQAMQEEAAAEVVEASAGGGMVTVKVSGALEVLEIKIDPKAIDPDDPELLADLIQAAVNEGLRSAQAVMERKMGGLMGGLGGLGLPGLSP